MRKNVVSVGIDVCKAKVDVALLYTDGSYASSIHDNTEKGMKELADLLTKQKTAATVPCIVESTGNLHFLCALMLSKAGFLVNVINPLITKKYQRSSIRNAKSDPIDAKRLAEIGMIEKDFVPFQADQNGMLVRKIISYIASLEKTLQKLTTSRKQLASIESTLGDLPNLSTIDQVIKDITKQIKVLQVFVEEHTNAKARELSEHVPGLSHTKAAIVMGLIQHCDFTHRDQLVAFAGLDLALRQSGTWAGKQKLSKRGNAYLRKTLYQIAWGLKMHNPEYARYFNRLYREDGKHYTTALIATARKFLRHFYAFYWKESVVYN